MAKCALYRHFDKNAVLLYVGISNNPFARTRTHTTHADWFSDVARIDIEWHPSREAAIWFEEMAIAKENPKYNRMRPASLSSETIMPQRKGIKSRKPEVQRQIDGLVEEAASLGHKLNRARCLAVVQEQIVLIKAGRSHRHV